MVFGNYNDWRKHPLLRVTHIKQVLPGFGTAVAIFTGYIVIGNLFMLFLLYLEL